MGLCFQYFPQLHNSLNQNHVAPLTTLWSLMVDKASPFSSSLTCRTLPENSLEADPLGIRDFKELVKIFPTHFRLFAFSVVFWRTCFYGGASLQKKECHRTTRKTSSKDFFWTQLAFFGGFHTRGFLQIASHFCGQCSIFGGDHFALNHV